MLSFENFDYENDQGRINKPLRQQIEGTITLSMLLGKIPYIAEKQVKFYVVQVESPYNAILGRPLPAIFQAVTSIPHLKLKFLIRKGVGEMRGD